ncbi:MBL fold metallo-hydrolase [Thiohalobacter sp. IOR34]|uniref:MBL fold metallo-hydrolase n=1 Tax=Thiohalobacter sp. IOR34 TaxID=3057176 RepID=UPI0025AF8AF2|nr:MBL fold metallo-hydrolase [Thiohalobacter sp. IOR34]WJW74644.1 MBL fold metallo-hydrolase [Thiohalobacter sp. IOR34]
MPQGHDLVQVGPFDSFFPENDPFVKLSLAEFPPGIHSTDDFLFKLDPQRRVVWVVSRTCDHANGRLSLSEDGTKAVCPNHGWCLDLERLTYSNVAVSKKQLEFSQSGEELRVKAMKPALRVPEHARFGGTGGATVRFVSHACVAIDIGGIRIVTDPWLLGPCFMTGWWHASPPKADALDILASADLVYISHNHPDHMDRETLHWLLEVDPDKPLLAPGFATGSVARPLREMGFTRVTEVPFNLIHRVGETPVILSIFNSGDFRDDSGLFVASDDFSCLLTVDSAALNNMILPRNVDLLCTAFAGGSSGFPWCFEHLSLEERVAIGQRFKGAVRGLAAGYVRETRPRAYMPYAGYFTEAASRDSFIRQYNTKNSPDEIRELMSRVAPAMKFIDPRESDSISFDGKAGISTSKVELDPLYRIDDDYVQGYIDAEAEGIEHYALEDIRDYFLASGFRDDLLVYVQPSTDDFQPLGDGLRINFSADRPRVEIMSPMDLAEEYRRADSEGPRQLMIRVRRDPLWQVVSKGLPWEDLSIGFQCRVERKPDVYNSDFWFHFTNVYIGGAVETPVAGTASGRQQRIGSS